MARWANNAYRPAERSPLRWAAAAAALAAAWPGALWAQEQTQSSVPAQPTAEKPSVLLEADRLIEDRDAHQVIADGKVEVRYGERLLKADRLIYDTEKHTIRAQGNVEITEGGTVRFAEEAEIDETLNVGVATNFSMRLPGGATMASTSAQLRPDGVRQLDRAIYTACPVCKTDGNGGATWTLKARKITENPNRKTVSYRDVVLQVKGVPVFYLPYLSHPEPSAKRKSGLLMPDIGSSTTYGAYYAQPVYWAISPYQDLTLTPRYMTKVNPLLGASYRKNFFSGGVQFAGSVTQEQDFDGDGNLFGRKVVRDHLFGVGAFRIDEAWRWGFHVAQVSDDLYLRRYQINENPELRAPYTTDLSRLFSQVYTTRQSPSSYFDAAFISAQGLRAGDTAANLPRILPRADFDWVTSDPLVGGQLKLKASTVNLVGAAGVDSARVTGGAEWGTTQAVGPGLLVEPYAQTRTDVYRIKNYAGVAEQDLTRSVGLAGVELRYPFLRAGRDTNIIVEPIVAATYASRTTQDSRIPNEDSQAFELDESNLFRPNVTPNYDLWEPGGRVSVGMRATAIMGFGSASAVFGKRWKNNDDPRFRPITNIESKSSDYVGQMAADLGPRLGGDVRFRLDDENLGLQRLDASLRASLWKVAVSGRYFTVRPALRGGDPRQELTTGVNVDVTDNWRVTYGLRRDLDSDINLSQDASVSYRNSCFIIQLVYTQTETFDRVLGPRRGLQFAIGLTGLGSIAGNR